MDKKILSKIIAVMLVFTLTCTNFIFLMVYAGNTYASSINYEKQDTAIEKTDVNFDAYFISETNNKVHTYASKISNNELKLFINISVTKGYLKNAKVSISDANFKLQQMENLPTGVEKIDTKTNTVTLNQINKGENITVELSIEISTDTKYDLNNFSKDATVKLNGTFVNDSAKEINVEKSIILNLGISEEAESNLEGKIINSSIFEENGVKKELVQIQIVSNVIDNSLPVKTSEIEFELPLLNESKPEHVTVSAESTKATNGKNGTYFTTDNYIQEDNTIKIKVENKVDENNYVSWEKNCTDTYIVNLVYILDNDIKDVESSTMNINIKSKLSLYNYVEESIEKDFNENVEVISTENNVVTAKVDSTQDIYKGYMMVADASNTAYKQNIKINIGYNPIIENIKISKTNNYYTDENGNKYDAKTYYKSVSVSEDNLRKMLGEDGVITIRNIDGVESYLTINNLSIDFETDTTEIGEITYSKPISEGNIELLVTKYVKPLEYDVATITNFNKLVTSYEVNVNDTINEVIAESSLLNPTLQVSSKIKNNILSTVTENNNVQIKTILKTKNKSQKLYTNPTIEIELPSYVETAQLNSTNLFYDDEIKIISSEIITNSNGNKTIIIKTEGQQTKFNTTDSVSGATVVVNLSLIVDKTAPSTTQSVNIKVTDGNGEVVTTDSDIVYTAPTGMITLNSMKNYNSANEVLTSISGAEEIGKLDVMSSSRTSTETITVINNYNYTCGNVKIIGRTPTEGNKDPETDEELGSTFTAKMISSITAVEGIEQSDVTIYYSENAEANENLDNKNNGWTTTPENLEAVKSYLIVLNTEMKTGDKVVFEYNTEIPEGLEREESTYTMFKVYYTNLDGALKGTTETTASQLVGATTGEGIQLDINLSADVEDGADVKEGQVVEYTISVTNTGKQDATNIEVSMDIPKGTVYSYETYALDIEQDVIEKDYEVDKYNEIIEKIAAGETVQKTVLVTINEIKENEEVEITANATANITSNNEINLFTSNTIINKRVEGYFQINLYTNSSCIETKTGEQITYQIEVNGVNGKEYNNLVLVYDIPNELEYVSSEYDEGITQQINDNRISWTIENFYLYSYITATFNIKEKGSIESTIVGTCDESEEQISSNTVRFSIGDPKLEITHSSNNNSEYVTEGDILEYTYTIKNVGTGTSYNTNITDFISDGLVLKSLEYSIDDESDSMEDSENENTIDIAIEPSKVLTVVVTAEVEALDDETETDTVSHRFEVTSDDIDSINSTIIEHKVRKKVYTSADINGNEEDANQNDELTTVNSISGSAWIDTNKNGLREEGEQLLEKINVVLLNSNGETISSTETDANGAYEFNNVVTGDYIVAFLYDTNEYDTTTYQVTNGSQTKNNDAENQELIIDGEPIICAATDNLFVTSNLYNIDLGLIKNGIFDLNLTKTLKKVTVKTNKGTTLNEYDNTTLEKVEIPSKYLDGAIIAIEYEITVTNEGTVAGYVKKIVDYLSSTDLKFSSELNGNWYQGTDGNLYNSELANILLEPGDSETVKLVLTKTMTENNTGITNNTAEIYEAYNDEGIVASNSTFANKGQNENDIGSADIIIGVKTGVTLYITSILAFIVVLTAGIYVLNKKVINVSGKEG